MDVLVYLKEKEEECKIERNVRIGSNHIFLFAAVRGSVGVRIQPRGSDRVRNTGFQQKYLPGSVLRCPTAAANRVKTKRVVSGEVDLLRLRRITSSPSQTLRRRLVRTTDDGHRGERLTLAAVRRGFVYHTSRLVLLTTL